MGLEDEIVSEEIRFQVIGKLQSEKGLFRRSPKFEVALKITDEAFASGELTRTIEVPFDHYCHYEVGKEYMFTLFSYNDHTWYFYRGEAEWNKEQGKE